MRIEVVTLFPEFVAEAVRVGVLGRAIERGRVMVHAATPREFAMDPHRTVDDRSYGGGPGMVLKVEPARSAIRAAKARLPQGSRSVYLGADGTPLSQAKALELARRPGLLLLAGRYEGVDERLLEMEIDESISIGDYVLSGGELPALVLIDAIVRLLPGVLGDEASAEQDSFMDGLLDWPHYTRPEVIDGRKVPEILMSGNHAAIRRWRTKQALGRTWLRRRDLIDKQMLTAEQRQLLDEFMTEQRASGRSSQV
ncbi:tRNA (guanine-N1)-methyltransferase [Steroidobacter denitrificans]|uniref:tRNA (guanine-N(1)-)-methyltransferase n=1 Tax=Steroidobacter denitrificans TaxID=465721 RepID=A0A127FAB0_STEDE|nr:tRNA (guanosine(37)-N1)-methyltransferase TrmD [Steroidobacter denitrificans]AMN46489.1 tRNA (guanine-N1)-methyltransferase [Steroidobacter denitrificans]